MMDYTSGNTRLVLAEALHYSLREVDKSQPHDLEMVLGATAKSGA